VRALLAIRRSNLGHIIQTIRIGAFLVEGEGNMALTLPATKAVTATLRLVDAGGNPTLFDDIPVWSVSDPALLTVTPSPDGYSAEIRSVGPLGGGQVTVTGDADLGDGTRPLIILDDVTVIAGDAVTGSFSYGPVVD